MDPVGRALIPYLMPVKVVAGPDQLEPPWSLAGPGPDRVRRVWADRPTLCRVQEAAGVGAGRAAAERVVAEGELTLRSSR